MAKHIRPLLSVALDMTERRVALERALAVADYVDLIEAGTPLVKAEGISIVSELKQRFPTKLIVADMKTADVGDTEARLAFQAGADVTTVLGSVSLRTVEAVIGEARKVNRRVLVDLLGVEDLERVRAVARLGPDYLGVHTAVDDQKAGQRPFENVVRFAPLGVPLAVAGGLAPDDLGRLWGFPVGMVIVGGGITRAAAPRSSAQAFRSHLNSLWP